VNVEFERKFMAVAGELDVEPLREAVEAVHKQQNAHQLAI
jgi:hypothetical protein